MNRVLGMGLLVLAVIASAMAVVVLKHESRKAFTQLQVANEVRDEALSEWSRLQLELASLAELGRIEQTAQGQLNMTQPERVEVIVQQAIGEAREGR